MTNLDIFVLTSLAWSMICVVLLCFLYWKGYIDGSVSAGTTWESACKSFYDQGYEDGKEGRKKCVK